MRGSVEREATGDLETLGMKGIGESQHLTSWPSSSHANTFCFAKLKPSDPTDWLGM